MNTFIYSGWEFGAEADVALKSEEKGRAKSGAASFKQDIIVYQMTEAGIALKAGLKGMIFGETTSLTKSRQIFNFIGLSSFHSVKYGCI